MVFWRQERSHVSIALDMSRKEAIGAHPHSRGGSRRGALAPRVEALEEQVGDLNERVGELESATGLDEKVSPPKETTPEERRCPGCRLRVDEPRKRQCVWCGFVFSAAASTQRGPRGDD